MDTASDGDRQRRPRIATRMQDVPERYRPAVEAAMERAEARGTVEDGPRYTLADLRANLKAIGTNGVEG